MILSKIREPYLGSYFKNKQSKRYNNLKKNSCKYYLSTWWLCSNVTKLWKKMSASRLIFVTHYLAFSMQLSKFAIMVDSRMKALLLLHPYASKKLLIYWWKSIHTCKVASQLINIYGAIDAVPNSKQNLKDIMATAYG